MPVAVSALVPRVAVKIPEAANYVIEEALRTAAIEFCRQTRIVQENAPSVSVAAGNATHTIASSSPVTLDVVHIANVWFNGEELKPTTSDDLASDVGLYWPDLTGSPTHFIQPSEDSVLLFRKPNANGTLTARVALAPAQSTTALPDVLAKEWREAITAGALAWLFAIPAADFADPDSAVFYAGVFDRYLIDAKHKAQTSQTRARTKTRAYFF